MKDNPFAGVLTPVEGNQFIGREQLLNNLRNNVLAYAPTNIVGLPRMGKTSLVKQCFMEEEHFKSWLEEEKRLPLYVEMQQDPDPGTIWLEIVRALDEFLDTDSCPSNLIDLILGLETEQGRYQKTLSILGKITKQLKVKLILIIDEFDRVLHVPGAKGLFQKIRSLSRYGTLVICSRRTLEFIERSITDGFYNTNNFKQLFVGLFSDAEMNKYWEHYRQSFSSFPSNHFVKYKELIKRYAGNHPMLTSLSNNALFELRGDPHDAWNPELSVSQREKVERIIRRAVNKEFDRQIHYVEEQGLLETAIQMIVGTSRSIDPENLGLLLDYQFAIVVSSSVKREIFGYDLGPTTSRDVSKRYMCFSALTSHLMKEKFYPDIQGRDLLKEAELKFREVITEILKDICDGKNPFREEMVKINDDEIPEKREIWEKAFYQRIDYFSKMKRDRNVGSRKASDAFLDNLDQMREMKEKRISYDSNPTFDRSLINLVTSTTLGQLWHVFFKWQWQDFFMEIYDKYGCYSEERDRWRDDVFYPILDWRNAADHYNDAELQESFIEDASKKANEVIKASTDWLGERVRH